MNVCDLRAVANCESAAPTANRPLTSKALAARPRAVTQIESGESVSVTHPRRPKKATSYRLALEIIHFITSITSLTHPHGYGIAMGIASGLSGSSDDDSEGRALYVLSSERDCHQARA